MQPGTVAPRKAKNWKDVQLILSSIAMALTLGLWGIWASRDKGMASVQGESKSLPSPEPKVVEVGPMLLPGQTLYLMTPAPQTTATVSNQEQPRRRNKDRDKGGGNADAGTGSS
jgi:hypothetical protein